jgi:hypothetical protein
MALQWVVEQQKKEPSAGALALREGALALREGALALREGTPALREFEAWGKKFARVWCRSNAGGQQLRSCDASTQRINAWFLCEIQALVARAMYWARHLHSNNQNVRLGFRPASAGRLVRERQSLNQGYTAG